MIYRTDDATRWGIGKGANLTPTEIDLNFWALAERLVAVETGGASPNGIDNITVVGSQMTVWLDDGTALGPYTLPTAMIRYRGDWVAGAAYLELDLVAVPNSGVYLVLRDHTAGATFDANATDASGNSLYRWLFPIAGRALDDLADVAAAAPGAGEVLTWDAVALAWTSKAPNGGIADAPADGATYGRLNGAWSSIDTVVNWADIPDKPASFPPSAHTHPWGDVTGKPATVAALPGPLGTSGQVLKVDAAGTAVVWGTDEGGSGSTTFIGLSDTPAAMGAAGTHVAVNAAGTALEFVAPPSGTGGGLNDLSDVTITTPATAHVLQYDGAAWVNSPLAWAEIPDKPATFPPDAHTHTVANISDFAEGVDDRVAGLLVAGTNVTLTYDDVAGTLTVAAAGSGATSLDGLSDVAITAPAAAQVLQYDGAGWVNSPLAWAEIPDKPATFPPSAHTHPWSEVTSRPTTIDAMPATVGTDGQVLKASAGGIVWAADAGGIAEAPTDGQLYGRQSSAWSVINLPEPEGFTHWRLRLISEDQLSGTNAVYLAEIQFREAAGVAEQAIGGTAFGTFGSVASLFDGNNGSGTQTGTPYIDKTAGYQFATAREVVEVALHAVNNLQVYAPRRWVIEASNDGVAWTEKLRQDPCDPFNEPNLVPELFAIPTAPNDADTIKGVAPSAFVLTLLDDADAATARATLGAAALSPTVSTKAAAYTFALVDAGTFVDYDAAGAGTFTIPADATVNFPVGTVISGGQIGAGQLTIAAATGVVLNGVSAGSAALTNNASEYSLRKRAANSWRLSGQTSAVA